MKITKNYLRKMIIENLEEEGAIQEAAGNYVYVLFTRGKRIEVVGVYADEETAGNAMHKATKKGFSVGVSQVRMNSIFNTQKILAGEVASLHGGV